MENSKNQTINEHPQSNSSEKEDLDVASSKHNISGEYNPPSLPRRSSEYSPDVSSISSDHTSLTHGFSPALTPREEKTPQNPPGKLPPMPAPSINRYVVDVPLSVSKMADAGGRSASVKEGGQVGGSGQRFGRPSLSILRKVKREQMLKKMALAFRVFGSLLSLVSLSVMAADRNQGWALDSFDRYKEFRYFLLVNVIGFVYSGAQALNLGYEFSTGKSILLHRFRHYFDFAIDQMISYLLISASSSAATRVEDLESNWGKDKFTDMASTAVSMSFLAFAALASSSLISGYGLCTSRSL